MSGRRIGLHAVLIGLSALWLFPFGWAVYTSFRPYTDTADRGYFSLPGTLSLDNYVTAWQSGELPLHFVNTVVIVVPAVIAILAISLAVAFAATRVPLRFNLAMLAVFSAGSLIPPHVLVTPLPRLFLGIGLYDQLLGVVVMHVAFQIGFCTFVLASYMRTIPHEVIDAARLDGAHIPRLLWSVVAPLCRPAIAALVALETAWLYNDLLWGLVLLQTTAKRPVTTSLANLSGEFFTDYNAVAAAAVLVALPVIVLFFVMRRHLTRGLALGATNG
jgi:multiple sugar transport system permease protein